MKIHEFEDLLRYDASQSPFKKGLNPALQIKKAIDAIGSTDENVKDIQVIDFFNKILEEGTGGIGVGIPGWGHRKMAQLLENVEAALERQTVKDVLGDNTDILQTQVRLHRKRYNRVYKKEQRAAGGLEPILDGDGSVAIIDELIGGDEEGEASCSNMNTHLNTQYIIGGLERIVERLTSYVALEEGKLKVLYIQEVINDINVIIDRL